jgi:integrase
VSFHLNGVVHRDRPNRRVRARSDAASASSLTGAFRKACKRAKIKDLRLHDLRHDAATRFWKTHKDLALLKEFLGDRDTESVMRYVNIDGKEASRLMRKRRSV